MKQKFFWLFLFVHSISFATDTPDRIRKKYEYLYSLPVQAHTNGAKSFHKGKLFKREGILVLSLQGDQFEMAFQHGRLLQKEALEGALVETAKLLERAVRNAIPDIKGVTDTAVEVFYKKYSDPILKHAIRAQGGDGDRLLLEAYGLSEGSGIPLEQVLRGVLGPESLQVVLGERMGGKSIIPAGLANSCTDFVVKEEATSTGKMIIGRNTDYPLNGYFDKFPTVIYYQPTDGSQRYLSVTSAGIHNAGVVAFNESGLFIGVHTIPTTEVSTEGNPVFLVGQEVMKTARTFDEAVSIFEKYKPAAGWTYTLASTKENRVASIELTNKRIAVRESKPSYHAQTNHYLSQALKGANLELNSTITEDSQARLLRSEALIQRSLGNFSFQEAFEILGDKWDPINQKAKGFGNVVAVNTTLTSVVFDLSSGRLFMANGMAPVSLSTFVELPLIQEFKPENFSGEKYSMFDNSHFHRDFPLMSKAEQKFIEAKHAYEIESNPLKASKLLEDSIRLDPDSAAYPFVHGILAIKSNNLKGAEASFRSNLDKSYLHYRLASLYYLGRIWASQGKSGEALKAFHQVLREGDPHVERTLISAVQKVATQVKRRGRLALNPSGLVLFMAEGDMVEY